MGRRKNQASGCGWGLAVLIAISVAGPLAPLIALILGVGGIVYVLKRLGDQTPVAEHAYRPAAAPLPHDYTMYDGELRTIQKKLSKPGRWKTQLDRLREASTLKNRIEKTAANAPSYVTEYGSIISSLNASMDLGAKQAIPAINRHFMEQTEKLQETTSTVRIAKAGQALLDQLNDIASIHPALRNVTATLALPISEMVSTAEQTNSFKTRIADAKKAERQGKRDEALSEYLDLLYALKTDNIDDDEQANEIGELEDHVRRVVHSYGKPHKGKKNSKQSYLRRMPNP